MDLACYHLDFDVKNPKENDQFTGWPRTIKMQDNYGRKAKAWLPTLNFNDAKNPVVQIIDESDNSIV